MALLQPSPETYEIFDDIILLNEGKIAFHGPRQDALPFFASLGLVCPPRKAAADFLQEVLSKKDQSVGGCRRQASTVMSRTHPPTHPVSRTACTHKGRCHGFFITSSAVRC